MQILKRIAIGFLCVPLALAALFAGYEVVGMAVNHIATGIQAGRLEKALKGALPEAEILRSYSETGNTSGTGNHVDMLSIVLFRTDLGTEEAARRLEGSALFPEGCVVAAADKALEKAGDMLPYFQKLEAPEDLDGCIFFYLHESAPFSDTITGH